MDVGHFKELYILLIFEMFPFHLEHHSVTSDFPQYVFLKISYKVVVQYFSLQFKIYHINFFLNNHDDNISHL